MKQLSGLFCLFALCTLFSCNHSGKRVLFDGQKADQWELKQQAGVKNNVISLPGKGDQAILKNGKFKNFMLTMEVKTLPGAKGSVAFHTDKSANKGYKVSLNNNSDDPIWWKKTGSLESVRNLTKSFIKENEWFKLGILVDGSFIEITINDEPVVEYVEPDQPFRISPNQAVLLSEGTFALLNDSPGEIEFRNIEVFPLNNTKELFITQIEPIDEQSDEIIRLHQEDFPVLDYHVHLKGGLTKKVAAGQSRHTGINYAVAPNCGIGFPITNDEEIYTYLDTMRQEPVILAMQAEGREWLDNFSPEARNEFDYVFTDALTFRDHKGRRTRLWIPEEVWIDNGDQNYMDLIVDRICDVLKEPVDIYVNPCFLPSPMDENYDAFWTEERMNKFVDALAKSGKALEINELYQIPNKAIIQKAKDAGVKFTFGSNNVTPDVSDLSYSIRMKKECDLKAEDMYKPKVKL